MSAALVINNFMFVAIYGFIFLCPLSVTLYILKPLSFTPCTIGPFSSKLSPNIEDIIECVGSAACKRLSIDDKKHEQYEQESVEQCHHQKGITQHRKAHCCNMHHTFSHKYAAGRKIQWQILMFKKHPKIWQWCTYLAENGWRFSFMAALLSHLLFLWVGSVPYQ